MIPFYLPLYVGHDGSAVWLWYSLCSTTTRTASNPAILYSWYCYLLLFFSALFSFLFFSFSDSLSIPPHRPVTCPTRVWSCILALKTSKLMIVLVLWSNNTGLYPTVFCNMPTLSLINFNIVCATLGGFISVFGLVSYLFKERFYLSEACLYTSILLGYYCIVCPLKSTWMTD